jgi:hypothetical protein
MDEIKITAVDNPVMFLQLAESPRAKKSDCSREYAKIG